MTEILFIIIYVAVSIALFLLFRGVMLWYYKIDERLSEQKETNRLLKILIESKNGGKSKPPTVKKETVMTAEQQLAYVEMLEQSKKDKEDKGK
jgi:hypothetical protein